MAADPAGTALVADVRFLGDRHLVVVIPVFHAVVSYIQAAVITKDHVPSIARIDPQGVVIHVHVTTCSVTCKHFAAIFGAIK